MTDVRAHTPLAKRVVRPVARVLGVPVGIAFMLLLRLTGRKAGVALMYHSVDRRAGDPARELVPPHEAGLFEAQVRHVARHYRVVPADRLLEAVKGRRRGQRFPVAITFDDDLACHATIAAPVLRELGAPATFFLSGASLDRPFSFHFERLQRAWDGGVADLPTVVGGTAAVTETSLHGLGWTMVEMSPEERDGAAARLLEAAGPDPEGAGMRREQVRELASAAGMTVGFHTFRHDPLDRAHRRAARRRDARSAATSSPSWPALRSTSSATRTDGPTSGSRQPRATPASASATAPAASP